MRDTLRRHYMELVRLPSPSGHEEHVREYCQGHLSAHGFEGEVDRAGNLSALRRGRRLPPWPLLNAHMDTVQCPSDVEQIADDPDGVIIEQDNHIQGAGVILGADDKCGIAIILALAETTTKSFKVLLTVDEERGQEGVKRVSPRFYDDVSFCLSLDRRGDADVITEYRGRTLAPAAMVGEIIRLAHEAGGRHESAIGSMADAFHIAAARPVVNLSAGFYDEHTRDEYADLDAIVLAARVTSDCIREQRGIIAASQGAID